MIIRRKSERKNITYLFYSYNLTKTYGFSFASISMKFYYDDFVYIENEKEMWKLIKLLKEIKPESFKKEYDFSVREL